MNDITFYLRSLFIITCKERIPCELRCVLVESQSKTEPNIERMNDITFYLCSFFVITCKERIPCELRYVLLGSQSKTEPVIVKVA
ncbi:hypothetical protein V1478_009962 [Vespula squamosa]|uniref:Uncharacterized protein n=1 Tax=Vespula squamosa TaxID=30214 RepID=A0ABD2AJX2_VESSQ